MAQTFDVKISTQCTAPNCTRTMAYLIVQESAEAVLAKVNEENLKNLSICQQCVLAAARSNA